MRSDEKVMRLGGCAVHSVHPDRVAAAAERALPEESLNQVAAVFKLLGDPTRARLLYALLETGELCVCDLAAATAIQEATASQSLRMLRACGVVTARRDGRLMYYRLADDHVRMLLDLTREHVNHETSTAPAPPSTAPAPPSTARRTAP